MRMVLIFQIMLPDFVSQSIYTIDIKDMLQIMLTDFVSTVTGKDMNGSEKSRTWERSLVNVRSAAIISASYNNEERIRTNFSRKMGIFHYLIDVQYLLTLSKTIPTIPFHLGVSPIFPPYLLSDGIIMSYCNESSSSRSQINCNQY